MFFSRSHNIENLMVFLSVCDQLTECTQEQNAFPFLGVFRRDYYTCNSAPAVVVVVVVAVVVVVVAAALVISPSLSFSLSFYFF